MIETVQIDVERYTTDNGDPTCSLVYGVHTCKFLRTTKFGLVDTCVFAPALEPLDRGDRYEKSDQLGYLIPCEWCIIWNKK